MFVNIIKNGIPSEDANFDDAIDSIMSFYKSWEDIFNQYWNKEAKVVSVFSRSDGKKETVVSEPSGFVNPWLVRERETLKSTFAAAIESIHSGVVFIGREDSCKTGPIYGDVVSFRILQKITSYRQIPWISFRKYVKNKHIDEVYYFGDQNETQSGDNAYSADTSFITYMTIVRSCQSYEICLYPDNEKYSCYRFTVKEESVRLAQFYLWAYFSSLIKNKRDNFRLKPFFDQLGIIRFEKLGRYVLDFY